MSTIYDAYINALLADATYALDDAVANNTTGQSLIDKLEPRMTETLAKFIGDNFVVVTHIDTSDLLDSGFDATVWRDTTGTGKTYVSMRGTEGAADFVTDLDLTLSGLAREQIVDMVNWWLRNTAGIEQEVQQVTNLGLLFYPFIPVVGTGVLSGVTSVSVNGHSLGGHLATAFSRLFGEQVQIEHTSTYNSAGFNLASYPTFLQLELLLGSNLSTGEFPIPSEQSNYFAENGISITTQDLTNGQVGQRIALFNEESSLIYENHFMYKLTDSLALQYLLSRIDSSVEIANLNSLFSASSAQMETSLEYALDAFRELFDSFLVPTPAGDAGGNGWRRAAFHENLAELNNVLFENANTLTPTLKAEYQGLSIVQADSLKTFATSDSAEGLAYRYSLQKLIPFAVSGSSAIYSQHNANGELNSDNFSASYLADRALLLAAITERNINDTEFPQKIGGETIRFNDADIGEVIAGDNSVDDATVRNILFGNDGNNNEGGFYLVGGDMDDRIYGQGGEDRLVGQKGNDRLEGGNDDDTYIFNTTVFSTGNDTILDLDGDNTLTINGRDVSMLVQPDPTVASYNFESNGNVLAIFNHRGKNLDIQLLEGEGGFVTIEEFGYTFSENKFGLDKEDQNEELPTGGSWVFELDEYSGSGDGHNILVHSETNEVLYPTFFARFYNQRNYEISGHEPTTYNQISLTFDAENFASYARDDVFWDSEPVVGYVIGGGDLADSLTGGYANDFILGYGGDDIIHAADNPSNTYDFIFGGAGNDYLYGEDGNDFIWGNANGFVNLDLWTEHDDPATPEAIDDQDQIFGGAGNDLLSGGNFNDIIFGGDDNDWIGGGAGSDFLYGDLGIDYIHGDKRGLFDVTDSGGFSYTTHSSGGFGEAYSYDDYLYGGPGDDVLYGDAGNDQLFGGEDNDQLIGDDPAAPGSEHGDDLLDGGPGNDKLWGNEGDDELLGGDGDDLLYGEAGDDVLRGGAGVDVLQGGEDDDDLYGGSDEDELYGNAGDDTLFGGGEADIVSGNDGDDTLYGDSGADLIWGGDNDDTLTGGLDDDVLQGGAGDDCYLYSLGDGIDTIDDTQGQNVLKLGFSVSEVSHLQGSSGSRFLVLNNGDHIAFSPGTFETMQLQFAGGGSLDTANFEQQISLDEATTLTTNEGNDTVWGSPGSDTINAGGGNDTVYGDGIHATGAGDVIHGGSGDDTLRGNHGDDTLYGDEGDDTLDGDAGNDTLIGGPGDDRYFVWTGEGDDTIDNTDAGNGLDVLVLKGGVNSGSTTLSKVGDNLLIDTGAETVTVLNHFKDYGSTANQTYAIDSIEFSENDVLDQDDIAAAAGLPYAQGWSYTRGVGEPLQLLFADLLSSATAVDNHPLTILSAGNVQNGALFMGDDYFVFTPDEHFAGQASFDYTASDGTTSITTTVAVEIENTAPVAVDDELVTADVTADIPFASLLANDSDVDGQPLTISAVGNSLHGSVSLDEVNETVSFVPEAGYIGPAEFDYVVSDGFAGALGGVSIYVGELFNTPPVANADSASTSENQPLELSFASLLLNDSDEDNDTLTVQSVSNAVGGSVIRSATAQTVTFTPTADFTGSARFDYTVSDGEDTSSATVTVTVNASNEAPEPAPDQVFVGFNEPRTILVDTLLANDKDPDDDALTLVSVGNSANGSVVLNASAGTILYSPQNGFSGATFFTYTLGDGQYEVESTVNIVVLDLSLQLGTPGVDSLSGTSSAEAFDGLAGNDTISAGSGDDILIGGLGNDNLNGGTGEDTYYFNTGEGRDTITEPFSFFDRNVLVLGPDVEADTVFVHDGARGVFSGIDIWFTGNSASSFDLQFQDGPTHDISTVKQFLFLDGTLRSSNGSPYNDIMIGGRSTNTMSGGHGNDYLIARGSNDVVLGEEGDDILQIVGKFDSTVHELYGGAGNDSYVMGGGDGDGVASDRRGAHTIYDSEGYDQLLLWGNSNNVTLSKDGDDLIVDHGWGSITVERHFEGYGSDDSGQHAIDSIKFGSFPAEYTVSPAGLRIAWDIVDVNGGYISESWNQQYIAEAVGLTWSGGAEPVANPDTLSAAADTPLTIDFSELLDNDTDADDSDELTVTSVQNPSFGTVTIDSLAKTVTFTPGEGFTGNAGFSYTMSDGTFFDSAAVTVSVAPGNVAPTVVDDSFSGSEDVPMVISFADLLENDSDADDDLLSVDGVSNPSQGTVTISGAGEVTFTPAANYNGPASFDYAVSDGNATSTATVTLNLSAVNDAPVANADSEPAQYNQDQNIDSADLLANDDDIDGDELTISGVSNPENGTATLSGDGKSITFSPAVDYFGPASFEYTAFDGELSSTATVSLDISEPNTPPTAVADNVQGAEDDTLVIPVADLLFNDSDNNDDKLSINAVGDAVNGSVSLGPGAGEISFTPDADFNGDASFSYTVTDEMDTSTTTVSVNVLPVNDDPVGAADDVDAVEDEDLVLGFEDLLGNDDDIDGDALTVAAVGKGVNGSVSFGADPETIIFTPAADFNGSASFEYSLSDKTVTVPVAVTITVAPANDAPTAVNDALRAEINTERLIQFDELLKNDSDIEGDEFTISGVSNPVNGAVTLNDDDSISFTPATDHHGIASFDYTLSDDNLDASATVVLTIAEPNTPPTAVADDAQGSEDDTLVIYVADLLDNDSDKNGDSLNINAVGDAVNGSVSLGPGAGEISFTPDDDFNGDASFSYTVTDEMDTSTTTVSVNVLPVNDDPIGLADDIDAVEDVPLELEFKDLLGNDSDVDGDTLRVTAVGKGVNGSVSFDADQQIVTFTPATDFHGSASFEYSLSDDTVTVPVAVNVTVAPANDGPVAEADTVSALYNQDRVIDATELLANDDDIDGDELTISGVSNPENGTATLSGDGKSITFSPTVDYFGPASFEYTAFDGELSSTATVSLDVPEPNTPPTAVADNLQGAEDDTLVIPVADLLFNDSDNNDDKLSINAVGDAVNGSVSLGPVDGQISFTPDANFNGDASFRYSVTDEMDTSTTTVSVDVLPVNDDPVGVADDIDAVEDVPLELKFKDLLDNDSDIDSDELHVAAVGKGVNGSVSFGAGPKTIIFTPSADFNGSASFEYSLSDDTVTVPVAVNIEVTPVNDGPVANDDVATTLIDTPLEIPFVDLLGNDADVDGDTLTILSVSSVSNGTPSLNAIAQTVTFTPEAGFAGSAVFSYEVSDGSATDGADVTVVVSEAAPEGAPDVGDDTLYGLQGVANQFEYAQLLANDIDRDGDTLSIVSISRAGDTLSIASFAGSGNLDIDHGEKQFSYTPAAGVSQVELTYDVTDGEHTVAGTVTLKLYAVDDSPLVVDAKGKFKGSNGNDLVVGGPDKNDLKGEDGNDTLIGGPIKDKLKGGDGNDVLIGGPGEDELKGEKGNDTYVFDLGDGHNKVDNNSKTFASDYDVIAFADRITPELLWFSQSKNDLVIDVIGSDDQVEVKNFFKDNKHEIDQVSTTEATLDKNGIEALTLAMSFYPVPEGLGAEVPDEVETAIGALRTSLWRLLSDNPNPPDAGPDTLYGLQNQQNTFDLVELFANDIDEPRDVLSLLAMSSEGLGTLDLAADKGQFSYTPALDESLVNFNYTVGDGVNSASSTVTLHLYDNSDPGVLFSADDTGKLNGNGSNDVLIGSPAKDDLKGGDGNDLLVGRGGDDKLKGGDGNDWLIGGPGNDELKGEQGNDTYVFDFGDGHDKIDNNGKGNDDDFDVIQFLSRVTPNDLWFSRQGDDLLIDVIGTNDQVEVDKWFKDDNHRLDQVVTAAGTLDAEKVDVLIAAMAGYSPPEGYGGQWTTEMEAALLPEINAAWDL